MSEKKMAKLSKENGKSDENKQDGGTKPKNKYPVSFSLTGNGNSKSKYTPPDLDVLIVLNLCSKAEKLVNSAHFLTATKKIMKLAPDEYVHEMRSLLRWAIGPSGKSNERAIKVIVSRSLSLQVSNIHKLMADLEVKRKRALKVLIPIILRNTDVNLDCNWLRAVSSLDWCLPSLLPKLVSWYSSADEEAKKVFSDSLMTNSSNEKLKTFIAKMVEKLFLQFKQNREIHLAAMKKIAGNNSEKVPFVKFWSEWFQNGTVSKPFLKYLRGRLVVLSRYNFALLMEIFFCCEADTLEKYLFPRLVDHLLKSINDETVSKVTMFILSSSHPAPSDKFYHADKHDCDTRCKVFILLRQMLVVPLMKRVKSDCAAMLSIDWQLHLMTKTLVNACGPLNEIEATFKAVIQAIIDKNLPLPADQLYVYDLLRENIEADMFFRSKTQSFQVYFGALFVDILGIDGLNKFFTTEPSFRILEIMVEQPIVEIMQRLQPHWDYLVDFVKFGNYSRREELLALLTCQQTEILSITANSYEEDMDVIVLD